ncbi:prolyl oligopeptidase family serine peptidase [Amycolatopsis sp. OK19-0408]|uniref:Prolyl oligopeptidase family serine peptidase n=1 Tax=Amycolatopsis iheyensis TaxID=2945988 RepID=A0A9X2N9I6_9PSEU|nr:prolyl oligopeptidase family serine peptidase [Amycolatopsis iheyensis]MCR6482915.1 prolyl oligopeptidase family serine peptidase [Amycolatopsis iheyensis]
MSRYPATRTTDAVVEVAGVTFPDPYQWLEERTDEVRRWQDEQAELADAHVKDWPHFDTLREGVRHFFTARSGSYPSPAGSRWVRSEIPEGATQARVILSDERFGDGEVLFDATDENPAKPPFVSWVTASPDGRYVAVGVCDDGSERNTIRLIDSKSGERLPAPPQPLLDNWTGGARWLPDSSGFFFTSMVGENTDLRHEVLLYRPEPDRVTKVDAPWLPGQDYRTVVFSTDGRRAIAVQGMLAPIPVAVADLPGLAWRPFVTDPAVGSLYGHLVGDRWIAVSDFGAPRGRVIAVALDGPAPSDPATWDELVPESAAALRSLTPVGDHLYVLGLEDTYSQVRIFTAEGAPAGHVPLPGRGAVIEHPFPLMALHPEGRDDEYAFAFTTLTSSAGYYRHRPGSTVDELATPRTRIPDAVVEDGWATSPDGTRVPYHLVRRADVRLDRPRPTLVFGYGGFNAPWHPVFLGPMAAFVAAGGVLAHVHLHGGGEFGREWWEQGRQKHKKNCYDDLHAIAEDLVATGVTSPGLLAVSGGSNGGLLAGVAATLRPALWAVAVPRVPFLDAIGATRDGYGRFVIDLELADLDDPDDVRRLASLSPYHLVRDGVDYPAVYLDAGDTDPRCPPWHARKFAARLQAATSGPNPVLLRVWRDVGHGWATDKDVAVEEHTSWLAFVMKQLGVTPRRPDGSRGGA